MIVIKLSKRIRTYIVSTINYFIMETLSEKSKQQFYGDDYDSVLNQANAFFEEHASVKYKAEIENIPQSKVAHKWVGAQCINGKIVGIPNDEDALLVNEGNRWIRKNVTRDGKFKWTGGCVWNGALYCFPRTSSTFLKYENGIVEEMPISVDYKFEHHYSGVCTKDGVVYQPPRNTNHILKTRLVNLECKKINIVPDVFRCRLSYCGGILHPNGFIYFFPVKNCRVIKLNPQTDEWCFIGKKITSFCFDAKIGPDGNIYGFNHGKGILKIDVETEKVEIIHKEIKSYAYGTKIGINGHLYSIPGDSRYAYEYNPFDDVVQTFFDTHSSMNAKYAGGVTTPYGKIVCVPAEWDNVLIYKPNKEVAIPNDVYDNFFVDNY